MFIHAAYMSMKHGTSMFISREMFVSGHYLTINCEVDVACGCVLEKKCECCRGGGARSVNWCCADTKCKKSTRCRGMQKMYGMGRRARPRIR